VTRILLVHQPVDGGVARHVSDLFTGLTASGYEVVLCGPALPAGTPMDAPHKALAFPRAVAPRADLAALRGFASIVSAVRPDLIHAHSSKAGAVARLGRLVHPRTPVLYTPHGYAFAGFFERDIERFAYREAERVLAPLARRVIAVCAAEARLAATIGPARRIRVVHNGVDPADDGPGDPQMRELARRGPVICVLTLLRPGKGVETLIDALPAVLAAHPEVQVAIVGEGPDREALLTRTRTRGVASAVHFLGPSVDPMGVLRVADVFVLPSWAESFPYVILEAMSVGVAIVASAVGGITEAIDDGQSGLLVPARDVGATASALVALLGDREQRARLGTSARQRVELRFSRAAMIESIVRVYEEALA
jgi:glycosyltransferase involved in cell wall biosynthesis